MINNNQTYRQDINAVLKQNAAYKELSNKKILITGATGMVGRCLIDVLMAASVLHSETITIIAIAISFCGAAGLCSIISFADTDPANTPILAVIASICCILVLTLVLLYIHFRKKYPSSGGVCIDIFIIILTFIPFLFIYTDILDIIDMFITL